MASQMNEQVNNSSRGLHPRGGTVSSQLAASLGEVKKRTVSRFPILYIVPAAPVLQVSYRVFDLSHPILDRCQPGMDFVQILPDETHIHLNLLYFGGQGRLA